jgi:dipeptidyl aminopeptidase/acylaminoacyl peptidase
VFLICCWRLQGDASQPSVSRKSNRLVYAQSVRDTDIFRLPGPGYPGKPMDLISSTRADGAPAYSPDGQRIAFISEHTGSKQVWVSDGDGQRVHQLTSLPTGAPGCPRWSPDGGRIAFDSTEQGRGDIYVIGVDSGSVRRITSGPSTNVRPAWSLDGRWIYFGSNRSGEWEVWKTARDGTSPMQVTHDGGREAFENRQGTLFYYTKAPNAEGIWRVPLSGGPAELVSEVGRQGRWALGERAVYYVTKRGGLELLEFSSGRQIRDSRPGASPEYRRRHARGRAPRFGNPGNCPRECRKRSDAC